MIPRKLKAEGRRLLALGADALGAQKADRRGARKLRVRVVEHVFGEEAQGVFPRSVRLHDGDLDLLPQLLRRFFQHMRGTAGEGKDLAFAVEIIERETDREGDPLPQHGAEHLLLLAGKVDEAVDKDLGIRRKAAVVDLLREVGEPVCRVDAAVSRRRIKGFQHQGQIAQLVAEAVGALRRGG